ncbi:MAG: carboxypeptidase-like regulatory domain-containing protein [Parabacteroides gordonii]|nr:carboxypeptidase-like regulatory domain-containing protein [Parabacteroides gordonii]
MKGILLLILLLSSGFTGMAQKPAETKPYSGHLADEQGNGVEYATIVLLQDDYQKAGGTTDSNGNFILEAKAGTYTVIVQCLGYDPHTEKQTITCIRSGHTCTKGLRLCIKRGRSTSQEYRT